MAQGAQTPPASETSMYYRKMPSTQLSSQSQQAKQSQYNYTIESQPIVPKG